MRRILIMLLAVTAVSCTTANFDSFTDTEAPIYPDYAEVTVPENIAPLNFTMETEGPCKVIVDYGGKKTAVKGSDGLFSFRKSLWKSMMKADSVQFTVCTKADGLWKAYRTFSIHVSHERIDPWISYRLIPPGYQGWMTMGLFQRNLESYTQKPIFRNSQAGGNCVNCHSFANRSTDKMLFHARELYGGTILLDDGKVKKLNTKTDSTISALVYPYWHPSGDFVAFSVNATKQVFMNHGPQRIEVYDSASDVVVYDVKENSLLLTPLTRREDRFETFPTFSPDGKWLYFCSAEAVKDMPGDYKDVKYALKRIGFDAGSKSFSDTVETVYDAPAAGKSVSFPRISPDGKFLALTLHDFGNFSIWHKEADIVLLNLASGEMPDCSEMNSSDVDSYHSWSGNSRWLIFSSRREDGLYTRPYISYIDAQGKAHKPFLLPQKNPRDFYRSLMFSYNIPELMDGPVKTSERQLSKVVKGDAENIRSQSL